MSAPGLCTWPPPGAHLAAVRGLNGRRVSNKLDDLGGQANGLPAVLGEVLGVDAGCGVSGGKGGEECGIRGTVCEQNPSTKRRIQELSSRSPRVYSRSGPNPDDIVDGEDVVLVDNNNARAGPVIRTRCTFGSASIFPR